ncbi:MAG: hypothetical protein KGO53_13680 [Alphaproteobacteria bacterium]|nr:hypothetical protein [Alphaproteobacteria bacterium]
MLAQHPFARVMHLFAACAQPNLVPSESWHRRKMFYRAFEAYRDRTALSRREFHGFVGGGFSLELKRFLALHCADEDQEAAWDDGFEAETGLNLKTTREFLAHFKTGPETVFFAFGCGSFAVLNLKKESIQ